VNETLSFVLSPPALFGMLVWNFAVLSAIQLTVRLIGAYSALSTARSAIVLTVATLAITVLFLVFTDFTLDPAALERVRARGLIAFQAYVFQHRLLWFPLGIAVTAVAGYAVSRTMLRFKRMRSAVVAALGIGLLSAPWLVFLSLPT
jgi:hypothetical protein